MHELSCDEVQDAAPQFALDILDPAARADVAAHLIRCPGCREQISDMQESAARLLSLDSGSVGGTRPYPAGDPLDGDALDGAPRGGIDPLPAGRRRFRVMISLAAAVVLVVGTTLGPELDGVGRRPSVALASAPLMQAGRAVGTVFFYGGRPPTVELSVSGLAAKGRLSAELVALDGTIMALGSFKLYEGSGYWRRSADVDPSRLTAVDLLDGSGRLVAAAALT